MPFSYHGFVHGHLVQLTVSATFAMRIHHIIPVGFSVLLVSLTSCERHKAPEPPQTSVGKDGWLSGTTDEKLDTVATHLRGNDVVMWEVGHRHGQLYSAIESENRELARYHWEKILLTMELGVERRPARKASYDIFFSSVREPMQQALREGSAADMKSNYQAMTAHCAACHAREKVAWIPVSRPWEHSNTK